ncbi:uncharacterized protein LOC143544577 [Bidens hawaiensis]|uniref:uncharacterized protein LOC143544577 n=1 Tax=Bidens hawaiensis TaxID=980011 RepID=UPI0040497AB4
MLQEIAMEYGIKWDPKVLEQKICKPPPFVQETKVQETEKEKTEVAMSHTLKNDLPYNSQAKIEQKDEKPTGNSLPYKSRAEIEAQKERKHDHGHGHQSPYWSSNTSTCSETTTSPDDSASEDTPEVTKYYAFGQRLLVVVKPSQTKSQQFQILVLFLARKMAAFNVIYPKEES